MKKTSLQNLSDFELLQLFAEGEDKAFTEIYQRYQSKLYYHALKMLKDRDEAQDVIHDLFTKLWDKRDSLALTGSLSSYLYTSVRNRILDIFSHEKIVSKYQESLQTFINKGEFITDHEIREKELTRVIEKEISDLPPKMREVFKLSREEHLTYAEIAKEMDIAENTVRKHITNAIKKLKPKFSDFLIIVAFFSEMLYTISPL